MTGGFSLITCPRRHELNWHARTRGAGGPVAPVASLVAGGVRVAEAVAPGGRDRSRVAPAEHRLHWHTCLPGHDPQSTAAPPAPSFDAKVFTGPTSKPAQPLHARNRCVARGDPGHGPGRPEGCEGAAISVHPGPCLPTTRPRPRFTERQQESAQLAPACALPLQTCVGLPLFRRYPEMFMKPLPRRTDCRTLADSEVRQPVGTRPQMQPRGAGPQRRHEVCACDALPLGRGLSSMLMGSATRHLAMLDVLLHDVERIELRCAGSPAAAAASRRGPPAPPATARAAHPCRRDVVAGRCPRSSPRRRAPRRRRSPRAWRRSRSAPPAPTRLVEGEAGDAASSIRLPRRSFAVFLRQGRRHVGWRVLRQDLCAEDAGGLWCSGFAERRRDCRALHRAARSRWSPAHPCYIRMPTRFDAATASEAREGSGHRGPRAQHS